jgi:hypothetical protein
MEEKVNSINDANIEVMLSEEINSEMNKKYFFIYDEYPHDLLN